MRLFYYKAEKGNFGDDLNELLWGRLLGDLLRRNDSAVFVGIGSIFDTRLDLIKERKIIFGTGIASQRRLPTIDSSYDIRFLRGPISARAVGEDDKWISDSALAVRLISWPEVEPIRDVGFMPHFLSLPFLNWPKVCKDIGLHLISPQLPAEQTIAELRSCKRIITEAMHGAIVCDAFRVPWLRVTINSWQREDFDISCLKWLDWGLSVRADVTPVHLEPLLGWGRRMLLDPARLIDRISAQRKLVKMLQNLPRTEGFRLSNETLLREATDRLRCEMDRLKSESGEMQGTC
jgi:succinoglycan biosynthesis protein ExoV